MASGMPYSKNDSGTMVRMSTICSVITAYAQ